MIRGKHGIAALIRAAQKFQLVVTETLLVHQLGIDCRQLTAIEMCQAAKQAGLRAKHYHEMSDQLQNLPLPILVCLKGCSKISASSN